MNQRFQDIDAPIEGAQSGRMTNSNPILVLGATGKTGRRITQRLRAQAIPVREGSRTADPPFDWQQPATWEPVLRGTSAAYIAFYPDVAVPGAPEVVGAFADAALAAGTRRLVLLSGRGEAEAQRAEQVLADSGADWTVVRSGWFMQNFSEGAFAPAVAAGELALPAGERRAPFVDVDDVADVAVATLTEPGHVGETYDVTGPEALSHAEVAAEIARASGRPVRYEPISPEAFAGALARDGVPGEVVSLLRYLFEEVLVAANAGLGDGVRRALGREPRGFAEFARRAAAEGAWAPAAYRPAA